MAHDIFQDRRMFFVGATPWHQLGKALPQNATWGEAVQAAGFSQTLERPLFAAGVPVAIPDQKALIAADDGRYLATVGADYGVIQDSTAAQSIIGALGHDAPFQTGGLLGDRGQKRWLLGELAGEPIRVKGNDVIRQYLLAYWGHDGRTAYTLANCATRVVCANTVAAAMGEQGGFRVSIRHTSKAESYVQSAGEAFKALRLSYVRLGQWANAAADRRLSTSEVQRVLEIAHPIAGVVANHMDDRAAAKLKRVDAIHEKILTIYENHEIPSTRGTAWAMFNAVQGFAEHFAPTRAKLQLEAINPSTRAAMIADRSFFGGGASGGEMALAAVIKATGLPHPASIAA